MKIYRTSKKAAIIPSILLLSLVGVCCFIWIIPGEFTIPSSFWVLVIISLVSVLIFIFNTIFIFRSKVIITENQISSNFNSSTRILSFHEIKGFSIHNEHITLIPNSDTQKKIVIDKRVEDYDDIVHWASQYLTLLEDRRDDEFLLEDDINIAEITTSNRQDLKLVRAKQMTEYVNRFAIISSFGLLMSGFFKIIPPSLFIIPAFAPILTLLVAMLYGRLVAKSKNLNFIFPASLVTYVSSSLGLLLYSTVHYHDTFLTTNFWTYSAVSALLLFAAIMLVYKFKLSLIIALGLLCLSFLYSISIVSLYNFSFDNSQPRITSAIVVDKESPQTKSANYYLILSRRPPSSRLLKATVDKKFFNTTTLGDKVKIINRRGRLNIPWYSVKK